MTTTGKLSMARDLFIQAMPVALQSLYHPFLFGLSTGKLPHSAFQNYIGQDSFFLHGFSDAYLKAASIANSKGDMNGAQTFTALSAGVKEELNLHESYAAKWGVDLAGVKPQEATIQYIEFLETMYKAGGAVPSNPYAEWIHSYRTQDFEDLAATLEGLLNRYAHEEQSQPQELSSFYERAMHLELAFFGAQPTGDLMVPVIKPQTVVVDFDQTLTEEDTSSVIIEACFSALGTDKEKLAMKDAWAALASDFAVKYEAKVTSILPDVPFVSYNSDALLQFCTELTNFDRDSLAPVENGLFLRGITREALSKAALSVQLRPCSMTVLAAAAQSGAAIHVISINWSKDMIRSALASGKCQEYQLHSPDLEFVDGVSTGRLHGADNLCGSLHKQTTIERICSSEKGLSTDKGQCVYVGDSVTDILALLHADIGIIIGSSTSLRRVCVAFGVTLRPLVNLVLEQGQPKQQGVLYEALSWHDVCLALYGSTQK